MHRVDKSEAKAVYRLLFRQRKIVHEMAVSPAITDRTFTSKKLKVCEHNIQKLVSQQPATRPCLSVYLHACLSVCHSRGSQCSHPFYFFAVRGRPLLGKQSREQTSNLAAGSPYYVE